MIHQRTFRRGERGFALAQTAMFIVALTALVTVGVDVGRLAFTASEVQNMADVTATGAAKHLADGNGTAQQGAELFAGQNYVEGGAGTPSNLASVEQGTWDFTDPNPQTAFHCCCTGPTCGAVRVMATATVNNIFAGMFGTPQSTVDKQAIASYAGLSGGQPTLPIAIGECTFDPNCTDPSCLPTFTQSPTPTNNTAWTGFSSADANVIKGFLASPCGAGNTTPSLTVNDSIDLTGGNAGIRDDIKCLFDHGLAQYNVTEFLVPIVGNCDGNFQGTYPVVGFATVVISAIIDTGPSAGRGIELHAVFSADQPGTPGPPNKFQTGFVALVG